MKTRNPYWNHERLMWESLKVNRQMRHEAWSVVFLKADAFYLPARGKADGHLGWWTVPKSLPPIKKLDYAFEFAMLRRTARMPWSM